MSKIETQYNGYTIVYVESTDKWEASLDENIISTSAKLTLLKARLDKLGAEEKSFTRVPVLRVRVGWVGNGVESGTITSLTDDGGVWVSWEKGGRGKDSNPFPHLDTPENRAEAEKILSLYKSIKKIRDEIESISERMPRYQRPKAVK